ncbi:MAG: hypothetical protein ABI036_18800 [Fibrobacteria bacterium]
MQHTDLRNFKGGSWDLRKSDRRKWLQSIGFPDRRTNDRRCISVVAPAMEIRLAAEMLQWVTKSGLDE